MGERVKRKKSSGTGFRKANSRVRNVTKTRRKASKKADAVQPLEPAPQLSGRDAQQLRGLAHGLEPLVHVGHGGVTDSVIEAVSRALRDHELIKVRLQKPEDKHTMAADLASGTRSALCGLVGHTVILFKPNKRKKGDRILLASTRVASVPAGIEQDQ
jgi:RNA-binding protein